MYESIIFTTHRFTILDGATGFKFEDWEETKGLPSQSPGMWLQ
jgi:hypothetical protein